MDILEAVATRRSVRAFLKTPVDQSALTRVLDAARMSPSGYNFQPWEAVVVTGAPLADLSAAMHAATKQSPVEYVIEPPAVPQEYLDRRSEISAPRFEAWGFARGDQDARAKANHWNYDFYGAPAVLLCHFPRVMGTPQWADVGMWLQTVMLLLRAEGLDSCAQESLSDHAKLIKQQLGIDDASQLFFCGLAIGTRDADHPVNTFQRTRVPLERSVRFVGFD